MLCLVAVPNPIQVAADVFIFLKKLVEMRVYGDKPGAVASFIIRKEVMRLMETGVLKEAELLKAIHAESAKIGEGGDKGESLES